MSAKSIFAKPFPVRRRFYSILVLLSSKALHRRNVISDGNSSVFIPLLGWRSVA